MTTVRTGKCRHVRVSRRWRYGRWLRWTSAVDLKLPWERPDARVCNDCGSWLSLGPARDTPETAIELRAAELAAAWNPRNGVMGIADPDERTGWNGWPYRQPTNHGQRIGFLAAQIKNHERDLGDVNWAGQHMADHPVSYPARCIGEGEK
jgi:hypothetical protein